MTTYFTADPHLLHDKIIEYCDRPFKNTEWMWRGIKKNWNSVVQTNDEVWILGDLSMKGIAHKAVLTKMIESLNGTKHLVYGNHDRMKPRDYSDMGILSQHHPVFHFKKEPQYWFLGHDPAIAVALPKGSVYLCGHVHGLFDQFKSPTGVSVINVGVDVRNFVPVSEKEIEDILASGLKKGNYNDTEDRHNQ